MTNYKNNINNNLNQYGAYLVECYYHEAGNTGRGGRWFTHADRVELDGGTAQGICHLWNHFAMSNNLRSRLYYVASASDEDDARIQGYHLNEGI